MDQEKLIAMGLTQEQAAQVIKGLDGNFVTKSRFNRVNEERNRVRKQVQELEEQVQKFGQLAPDFQGPDIPTEAEQTTDGSWAQVQVWNSHRINPALPKAAATCNPRDCCTMIKIGAAQNTLRVEWKPNKGKERIQHCLKARIRKNKARCVDG